MDQHPKKLQKPFPKVVKASPISSPIDTAASPTWLSTSITPLPKSTKAGPTSSVKASPTVLAACKNPFSISSPKVVRP